MGGGMEWGGLAVCILAELQGDPGVQWRLRTTPTTKKEMEETREDPENNEVEGKLETE